MVIVIGPTQPGTGVIALAISFTASKSTSPVNLPSSRTIHPHINNNCTWFHVMCFNQMRFTYRNNENIRLLCDFFHIRSARMNDRYRCMLTQQQHSHWFSYDIASSYNNSMLTSYFDTCPFQNFNNTMRCTRLHTVFTNHQVTNINRVEAIHVLSGSISSTTASSLICFGSGD